jgi:hypothetical protein
MVIFTTASDVHCRTHHRSNASHAGKLVYAGILRPHSRKGSRQVKLLSGSPELMATTSERPDSAGVDIDALQMTPSPRQAYTAPPPAAQGKAVHAHALVPQAVGADIERALSNSKHSTASSVPRSDLESSAAHAHAHETETVHLGGTIDWNENPLSADTDAIVATNNPCFDQPPGVLDTCASSPGAVAAAAAGPSADEEALASADDAHAHADLPAIAHPVASPASSASSEEDSALFKTVQSRQHRSRELPPHSEPPASPGPAAAYETWCTELRQELQQQLAEEGVQVGPLLICGTTGTIHEGACPAADGRMHDAACFRCRPAAACRSCNLSICTALGARLPGSGCMWDISQYERCDYVQGCGRASEWSSRLSSSTRSRAWSLQGPKQKRSARCEYTTSTSSARACTTSRAWRPALCSCRQLRRQSALHTASA